VLTLEADAETEEVEVKYRETLRDERVGVLYVDTWQTLLARSLLHCAVDSSQEHRASAVVAQWPY